MKKFTKAICGVILGLVLLGGVATTSVSARPHVYVQFGYRHPYYGPYYYGYPYRTYYYGPYWYRHHHRHWDWD
jgi:hypothetical protein